MSDAAWQNLLPRMDNNNPYAPPQSPVEVPDGPPTVATAPLYTVGQLTLAAFLGSIFASAWLAWSNFKALGQPQKARQVLWWGAIAAVVGLGIAMILPDAVPNIAMPLATVFLVRGLAIRHFERILVDHFKAGGTKRSWWPVVGIGILSAVLLVAFGMLVMAAWLYGAYLITGQVPDV